jgi:hypothetical protein
VLHRPRLAHPDRLLLLLLLLPDVGTRQVASRTELARLDDRVAIRLQGGVVVARANAGGALRRLRRLVGRLILAGGRAVGRASEQKMCASRVSSPLSSTAARQRLIQTSSAGKAR